MSQLLVVEDEAIIRSALKRLLERHGFGVDEAGSVAEAVRHPLSEYDLIITDLRLPGAPGTDLIRLAGEVPVLVMTSYASLKSAVESMKMGAVDYIAKPFDHDEMLLSVQRILRERTLVRQNEALKSEARQQYPVGGMIGQCPPMQELFERIKRVAPTNATVLIRGESGTGKELVARALHEQSDRRQGPLISVNCAAIPDSLIESELFGHEKGAFTGASNLRKGLVEAADGGTLFLDEIGELPAEAQARLLRLIQEKEVRRVGSVQSKRIDARLVAATHRDLKAMAQTGAFRQDLYYRLHVVELRLPPLRERGADIQELAEQLLARLCTRLHRPKLRFDAAALRAINGYNWPGNVREMENAIERAVILCDDIWVTPELLAIDPETVTTPQGTGSANNAQPGPAGGLPSTGSSDAVPDRSKGLDRSSMSLEDYFQRFVLENQAQMTETELAQRLGISRKCLWERRQKYGIPRRRSQP